MIIVFFFPVATCAAETRSIGFTAIDDNIDVIKIVIVIVITIIIGILAHPNRPLLLLGMWHFFVNCFTVGSGDVMAIVISLLLTFVFGDLAALLVRNVLPM